MTVLGLDGCRDGWVFVAVDDSGFLDACFAESVLEALGEARERWSIEGVTVDIPIGLPDTDSRRADIEARKFIQPRGSSVFPTPLKVALLQETHALACAESRRVHARGKAISKQAFELRHKILEVGAIAHEYRDLVREGHPEVSFRAMAGAPVLTRKSKLEGRAQRRLLLDAEGIVIPQGLHREIRSASEDDVLDAAAMAWTARRIASGEAVSLPAEPEVFSDGWPSAIWY